MITPVILCGGSGSRLWPLSRKSFPKQFTKLIGEKSLFAAAASRFSGEGFDDPVIVTSSDFRFIVLEQLASEGILPLSVLIEPQPKNTAPAILAAAMFLARNNPDQVMLIAPSDHSIPEPETLKACIFDGIEYAKDGQIVTFGVTPSRPETGYGWLEVERMNSDGVSPVKRFVEKPDSRTAQCMFADDRFYWNSGMFLSRAQTVIDAFKESAGYLIEPVGRAVEQRRKDLGFLRLEEDAWSEVEDISIDYAVMERASNLVAIPFEGLWNDLGGWDAVALEMGKDRFENSMSGPASALDCENTLLRSECDGVELVGIGLKDIIAVAMQDAVLVADKSRAQEVKRAVEALRDKGAKQALEFAKDHRPWGWFETLALSERFQVKRIVVNPGAALSLQSHFHRSEHWIVVAGSARVTVDGDVRLITENQSVYVPLGAVHRLENPGKVPMVLIEVQTGTYLGEDDIVRYDDVYARGHGAKG